MAEEKSLIAKSRQLKERIEQLKIEEQTEERKGNLQRVAEIRYGLLRQAEAELAKVTAQMDGKVAGGGARATRVSATQASATQASATQASATPARMLKEEVDEED